MASTGPAARPARSPNVRWHESLLPRAARWAALGLRGATVWFTGLPASGKSTVAASVERVLVERGVLTYLLDGDNLRHGLNADLGFSTTEREENVRRVAEVARLFADAGVVALVPVISPYADGRHRARARHHDIGVPFLEVFVNTPVEECERRDPKGLYARARGGELSGLTGVDDPYEPPDRPDLELATTELSVAEAADRVVAALVELGVVPRG